MRFIIVSLLASLLASCSDVRSFEETSAQFRRDREQLQDLVEAVVACEGASRFNAGQTTMRGDCVGDIANELDRLGYSAALVDEGRLRVAFVNGDDGVAIGGVISGIAYHRSPGPPQHGERPLTDPPQHWFYFQHD